jgi:hypothetical protein
MGKNFCMTLRSGNMNLGRELGNFLSYYEEWRRRSCDSWHRFTRLSSPIPKDRHLHIHRRENYTSTLMCSPHINFHVYQQNNAIFFIVFRKWTRKNKTPLNLHPVHSSQIRECNVLNFAQAMKRFLQLRSTISSFLFVIINSLPCMFLWEIVSLETFAFLLVINISAELLLWLCPLLGLVPVSDS